MVNLIAGKQVVPELVQHDFTVKNVVAEINTIIPEGPERTRMLNDLAEVRQRLSGASMDGLTAAHRAAEIIITMQTDSVASNEPRPRRRIRSQ